MAWGGRNAVCQQSGPYAFHAAPSGNVPDRFTARLTIFGITLTYYYLYHPDQVGYNST